MLASWGLILLSLVLLISLAYRGWNVIFIAPLCAGVALLFNWSEVPIMATYTQVYMPAMGNFLAKFFPLFLLGALFGKLMDDSGSARAIAHAIVDKVGSQRAVRIAAGGRCVHATIAPRSTPTSTAGFSRLTLK